MDQLDVIEYLCAFLTPVSALKLVNFIGTDNRNIRTVFKQFATDGCGDVNRHVTQAASKKASEPTCDCASRLIVDVPDEITLDPCIYTDTQQGVDWEAAWRESCMGGLMMRNFTFQSYDLPTPSFEEHIASAF